VRDWSGGGDAEAAAGGGDERAPVSGRATLWLTVEEREVAAARRRSGEGEIVAWWGGGGISPGGGGVPFLKGAGERRNRRGSVGVERRDRRMEEAGHEQGVPADQRAAPGRQRAETGWRA
jgi:hypothetical protein